METRKTEMKGSAIENESKRDPLARAPGVPTTSDIATAGRNTGEAIGGAVGHAIGAGADVVVGAVAGGVAAGKIAVGNTAKPVNPTAEHEFWRKEFTGRPYFTTGTPYEQYGPAYQYGWENFVSQKDKSFQDVEAQLGRDWETRRGQSKLSWNHAKEAARDAWLRTEKALCAEACG